MSPGESLLERQPALARLQQALSAARAGQGRCVVIGGEAGVGKTSLLSAWAASAATREGGTRWLQGGCDPLRTPRPLGPLVDLAPLLPAELTDALHAGRTYNGLFPALLAWLRQSRPVSVLVIEDLHWADEATLDCVRYLGRRLAGPGFLLVLTLREAEAAAHPPLRQTLAALDADATDRLDLPALSPAAVEALAARHGRPAQGLHALTSGNPFYLTQVLKSAPGTLPGTLQDMVVSQADALPPLQRELVDTLSCSPGGLELDALLALHPEAMAEMASMPDPAGSTAQPLLQVRPPWLSFRHEVARQVVESALPPLRRWQIHRRLLGHVQGRQGATPGPGLLARQVHHAAAAGLSAEVLALAPQAATESEALGAYRSAVQLLQLALDHAGDAPPAQRAALLDRLALRSYMIQATEQSQAARREAIRLKQQAGDVVGSAVSLAQLAVQITPDPQALEMARQAVATLAPFGDTVAHGVASSALAISLVNAGQPSEALQHARHALRCAAAQGDEESRAHATSIAASVELSVAPSPAAFDRLQQCIDDAMAQRRPDRVAVPMVNLASVALSHGEHERVLAVAARGLDYCAERDLDLVLAYLLVRQAVALVELSRWDEALAQLARLERLRPPPARQLASAAILRSQIEALRGGPNDAALWQAHIERAKQGQADLVPVFVIIAAAQAAWLRQDLAEARRLATEGLEQAEGGWLVGQLRKWLHRAGGKLPPALLDLPPAHAAAEAGQLQQAHEHWRARGCRFDAALALLDGDTADQRTALTEFSMLGAEPAAQWARRLLQASGERGVARGPYRHVKADPLGLTQRERQIAELLAEGLSNPAIAQRMQRSERTVAHHVSAVLAKLQVSSRQQVAARLARAADAS